MKTVRLGGYVWSVLDTDEHGVMTIERAVAGPATHPIMRVRTRAKLSECDDEGAVTV